MRLRSRRRNLIVLSTRAIPASRSGVWESRRPPRRRRFGFMRTGVLLTVIGIIRLARTLRSHWRLSLGLSGVLLEYLGLYVFTGAVRGVADPLGLVILLFALLKNPRPDHGRSTAHYEVSHHLSPSRRPRGARPAEILGSGLCISGG